MHDIVRSLGACHYITRLTNPRSILQYRVIDMNSNRYLTSDDINNAISVAAFVDLLLSEVGCWLLDK